MKVILDQEKCIACGACVAIAPENFDFDESGLSKVINDQPNDKTIAAKEACPVYAIDIVEEKDNVVNFEKDSCDCSEQCSCGDDCECHKQEDEEKAA